MKMRPVLITISIIIILLYGCAAEVEQPEALPPAPVQEDVEEPEVKGMSLTITSLEFENNGKVPSKYSCDGDDVNPPLDINGIPEGTKSLVLIVDDPDAPVGVWDHWIVWNIKPAQTIDEDSVPGVQGKNSWGRNDWGGPCPPSGTHRYFFKLYALDVELELDASSDKTSVEAAMKGHVLEQAELVGKYSRE
jgi:Raf kinase inhibitor-like YbhB/YbcL family protein